MTAGQVVSESRRRSWKKVITVTRRRQSRTKIIPFLTRSSNCIMSHRILHMLSKTGFRYANYPGEGAKC